MCLTPFVASIKAATASATCVTRFSCRLGWLSGVNGREQIALRVTSGLEQNHSYFFSNIEHGHVHFFLQPGFTTHFAPNPVSSPRWKAISPCNSSRLMTAHPCHCVGSISSLPSDVHSTQGWPIRVVKQQSIPLQTYPKWTSPEP